MPKKNDGNPIVPIYFKSLELENIRCFGSKQVLNLLKPDGTLSQWTLLLGNNGVGKTTLLQCLAWMGPTIIYRDMETEDVPEGMKPTLDEEENDVLRSLSRSSKGRKVIKSKISATFSEGQNFDTTINVSNEELETCFEIIVKEGKLTAAKPIEINKRIIQNEPNLITYSASRRPGKLNPDSEDELDSATSNFDDWTDLYNPEEILHYLDYASLKEKGNGLSARKFKKMIEMLVAILPDLESIKDITIPSPEGVFLSTPYGEDIPFRNLSLGYKTTISWTLDLAWRLINKYPNSNNPLEEPAIVLIDEIDLHLHPLWQRKIMGQLSEHFPKTQFIATSHSPLMAQAAYDFNYAVLNKNNNEVEIENSPSAIRGWRVDQILTSEFFGLLTARGKKFDDIYSNRKKLLSKSILSKNEEKILKRLDEEIANLPTGDLEDIKAREIIQRAAEKLSKKKI